MFIVLLEIVEFSVIRFIHIVIFLYQLHSVGSRISDILTQYNSYMQASDVLNPQGVPKTTQLADF